MELECLADVVEEVRVLAEGAGWRREATRLCRTGSIYVELSRPCGGAREWMTVRVSGHKMSRHDCWPITHSVSRWELDTTMLLDLLYGPDGTVGDIL